MQKHILEINEKKARRQGTELEIKFLENKFKIEICC
jgi:hypothetical protein